MDNSLEGKKESLHVRLCRIFISRSAQIKITKSKEWEGHLFSRSHSSCFRAERGVRSSLAGTGRGSCPSLMSPKPASGEPHTAPRGRARSVVPKRWAEQHESLQGQTRERMKLWPRSRGVGPWHGPASGVPPTRKAPWSPGQGPPAPHGASSPPPASSLSADLNT